MKTFLLPLAAGLCLFAQTPAHKRAAGSAAAAKPRPAAGRPSLMNPASLKAQAPGLYKAKFETTKGDFVIEVHRDWAPLGADRFYNLVRNGFYDNAAFFRVLHQPGYHVDFMAQFGISAKPALNKVWEQATIKDDPVTQSNKRGYVTFATAGPNTRTTQVFINFRDNTQLDAQGFAPFGTVTEGMDIVEKLYNGYGEGAPGGNGPDQGRMQAEGKAYLDKSFPQLDTIKKAIITEPPEPVAAPKPTPKPAPHKAAPAGTKPAPKKTNP